MNANVESASGKCSGKLANYLLKTSLLMAALAVIISCYTRQQVISICDSPRPLLRERTPPVFRRIRVPSISVSDKDL